MKKLSQADLDLLKSRGKVVNGFTTVRDGEDDFKPTDRFPKFKFPKPEPTSLKNQIIDKVHEVYDKAEEIYNTKFNRPSIIFKKRGKVAGTAHWGLNRLNFNMVLAKENTEHFLKQTVTHECAHLIANKLYGDGWKKIRPHGVEWKSVMTRLGVAPSRCHSYDTTNSAAYQKAKFVYICSCRKHAVGPTVHKKIQKGHRYTCNICKGGLNFVKSAGRVSVKEALKA